MGRTLLRQREIEQKELYIGKILIFCEGYTEKNYFEFFKKLIKDKFSNIVIETETVGSNARAVYNYAESFLKNDQNVSKYAVYDKYLALARSFVQEQIEKTVDAIRCRFGRDAVLRASALLDSKLTGFNPKADHTIHPYNYFR